MNAFLIALRQKFISPSMFSFYTKLVEIIYSLIHKASSKFHLITDGKNSSDDLENNILVLAAIDQRWVRAFLA